MRPHVDQDNNLATNTDGFRSYLIRGAPIFTAQDVRSVTLTTSADGFVSTTLQLTPAAAERMRLATHDHRGLRLAIIVNHLVVSAPHDQRSKMKAVP